jgi:putative ABC transport system permease protein
MWNFAWRNLLTRPLRTVLALVGLSIPILGVLGLFSVTGGLRSLIGDTLSQIQGVVVLRENALSPVFSDLPAELGDRIAKVPGVLHVAAELMKTAPVIEGRNALLNTTVGMLNPSKTKQQRMQSLFDQPLVEGQDIVAHEPLRSAIFPSKMLPPGEGGGRFLDRSDIGKPNIVVSRKIARDYALTLPDGSTRPRKVGDSLEIGGKTFQIVGIYDTGSMFLDVVILMDIGVARDLLGVAGDTVSNFYVESEDPGAIDRLAGTIEAQVEEPRIDARSMSEFSANFGEIMGQLDKFLLMTVSLALVVGVVGIINTMLMSTTERFAEFGVLRTNGWSESDVLLLVTAESAFLGLMAGLLGCILAIVGTTVANQFLSSGLHLRLTPGLVVLGLGLSVVMGTLGGLYPAWRAARLVPMEAIRLGGR